MRSSDGVSFVGLDFYPTTALCILSKRDMDINKKSQTWMLAPWYVRFGAYGFRTYKSIELISVVCAVLGFLAPLVSFWLYWSVSHEYAYIAMAFTIFGLSAYLYSIVLIWLIKNRDEVLRGSA